MLVQSLRKVDPLVCNSVRQIEFPRHRYSSRKVRSLCKPCTASISPSNNPVWHQVCGLFFFVRRLDFRFGPFGFFPVFDSTCDLILDSTSQNVKAWYRRCFDSKPPNIPAYRPGDPGVFHSRCQDLWTHVTLLGLANPDAKFF